MLCARCRKRRVAIARCESCDDEILGDLMFIAAGLGAIALLSLILFAIALGVALS